MTLAIPFFLALTVLGPAQGTVQEKKPEPIFDEKADASAQIAGALARAHKENRRVLVEWGANWCSWCQVSAFVKERDDNGNVGRDLFEAFHIISGYSLGRRRQRSTPSRRTDMRKAG